MKNFYKLTLLVLILITFFSSQLFCGRELEISKDFTLFTSKNMQGFLKPFFTSLEESFNSNQYSTALYKNEFSIGLDLSFMGMFIPDAQKSFDAERPKGFGDPNITTTVEIRDGKSLINYNKDNIQPTIYGGYSTPIFSVPVSPRRQSFTYKGQGYYDSTIKSVAYVEGNRINFMSGLPILQLFFGLPTSTQLRLRFLAFPLQDELLMYYAFMVNQRIDNFFNLFREEDKVGLALNAGYHSLSRDAGIDIKSWSLGAHISKGFTDDLTGYAGIMLEGLNGKFKAVKDTTNYATKNVNSPYPEVQFSDPLEFDIESFNSFRILAGISYRFKSIEIHADAAYASQPILTFGISFFIGEWGKIEKKEEIKIEKIEKISQ